VEPTGHLTPPDFKYEAHIAHLELKDRAESPGMACYAGMQDRVLISQKVFTTSFCISQFPHKLVNLVFILVTIKDKKTDLSGNQLYIRLL
jgi:hypothetical protein